MEGNKGFTNLGNTCYMNSALQCLIHLPQLNPRKNPIFKTDLSKSTKKEYKLLKQWIQLYKEMWYEENENVINTKDFIVTFIKRCEEENIYFDVFNQNDVSEFLNGFINILHEEICRSVTITPNGSPRNSFDKLQVKSIETWNRFFNKKYSFIIKDFHGQLVNLTSCPSCNYFTTNFDPLLIISLDVNSKTNSIHESLEKYCEPFTLDDDNLWTCDKCSKKVKCVKKNNFWKLPDILIILIKQYNDNARKLDKFIEYPNKLNMESYCLNYINDNMNYNLHSICIHSGSLGGGHYYAYCKNLNDKKWRKYNDSHVSDPVTQKEVLSQRPYCLFYTRNK